MNKREIEIASLAASIASGCLPCLEYHKVKLIESGVNLDEIYEICNISMKIRSNANKYNQMKIDFILEGKSIDETKNDEIEVLVDSFGCDCLQ